MAVLAIARADQLKGRRPPGFYIVRVRSAVLQLDIGDSALLQEYSVVEGPYKRRAYAGGRLFKLAGLQQGEAAAE